MLELHRRAHSIAECLRGLFDGGTVAGTEFKAGKIRGVGNGIRVAAVSHIKGDSPYTGNLNRPRAEQEGGHVAERDAGHAAVCHGGPGAHESGWGIDVHFGHFPGNGHPAAFQHGGDAADGAVPAHGHVPARVDEQDAHVGLGMGRFHPDCAGHVAVPAGFHHDGGAQPVQMLLGIGHLVLHGFPLDAGNPGDEVAGGIARGMRINRFNEVAEMHGRSPEMFRSLFENVW